METWTSKKFVFALVISALSYALIFFGKLQADQWLEFMKWLGIAYLGANVADQVVQKVGGQ